DPAFDPSTNGARAMIVDATGGVVLDVTIPPGLYNIGNKVGWKVNGSASTYTYLNAGIAVPLPKGIKKFSLKRSTKITGLIKFSITGKNGSYDPGNLTSPNPPPHMPLVGTIILDVPNATTGLCGEAKFPSATAPIANCAV